MSSTRSPNSIDTFALDALRLSIELEGVSQLDAPGVRAAAIRSGRRSYQALLRTRESLTLSSHDASTADQALKAIDGRLDYLCSVTFRRNQWRRRQCHDNPEPVNTELRLPPDLLAKPSKPRWWRSYYLTR